MIIGPKHPIFGVFSQYISKKLCFIKYFLDAFLVKKLKTQEHYAKAGFSYHISVYITGSLDVNGSVRTI